MPESNNSNVLIGGQSQGSQESQAPAKTTLVQSAVKTLREILSISFWFYVLVKVFIFDLDVYLVTKFFPESAWLIHYKFFILMGILAVIGTVTRSTQILSWSVYIFCYPVIVIFWRIPSFIFKRKSWNLAFASMNSVISFFESFKYNFLTSALLLCAIAILAASSNSYILWTAAIGLIVVLFNVYIHRFIAAFKPSSISQAYITLFSWIGKHGTPKLTLDSTLKGLPITSYDQTQLARWSTNLQLLVLFNRVCLFSAKKLRDYQNSGFNVASGVLTTLILIIITVLCFAFTNYGIYNIDSQFFNAPIVPTFFTFIYYAFNNLLFNQVPEISPASPVSQSISMIENVFALLLLAIFLSIVLPFRNQRDSAELSNAINKIREQGDAMEAFIRDEYNIPNIENALAELQKFKANMVNILFQISDNLKEE